jgi:hypothetical protein
VSDPNKRVVVREGRRQGELVVHLHPQKLPPAPPAAPRQHERKYNIRVKKHDLILLDELAKQAGRPRSELINELLYQILLGEILVIEKLDARLLIAMTADGDATYDPLFRHWSIDVLASDINALVENVMNHGHTHPAPPHEMPPNDNRPWEEIFLSEEFNILKAKIAETQR